MRKILTLLLLLVATQLLAQNYPVTGITITLPQNPDANTVKWGTGSSLFSLSAQALTLNGRIDERVRDSRILVSIRKSGSKACGSYTATTAPSSNFTTATKVWTGANAVSLIGQDCTLPPGDYELIVQFFGTGAGGSMALSQEKTKSFTIRSSETQSYQQPTLISPLNNDTYNYAELKTPITFRWTPLVPRPVDNDLLYRIRLYEVLTNQSPTEAVRVNPALIDKETISTSYTALLPVLQSGAEGNKSFVWNVQSLKKDGSTLGGNKGLSGNFIILIRPVNDEPSIITLTKPAKGEEIAAGSNPRFSWEHTRQQPGPPSIYKIRIVEILDGQSPAQAFKGNKPHFEKDSLVNRFIQYPEIARKLEPGKRYAWGVSASRNPPYGEVKITESEINEFIVKSSTIPPCSCGTWGPVTYNYYPYGNNPPQPLQAILVNDTASITIMQGSKIWPQGGFTCTGGCGASIRADLFPEGSSTPILSNTGMGNVYEYLFNCGDYLLKLNTTCGPLANPCPAAYIKIHVDCTVACNCGQWSPVSVTVGNGQPATIPCDNVAAPVALLSTDAITLSATINCQTTGAGCFSTQTVDIYNAAGNIIFYNLALPLTNWIPPATVCGVFKMVLKGKCNNIPCSTCTIYFNRSCPPPPTTCTCAGWNAIPFTNNGVPQTPITACNQTVNAAQGSNFVFSPTFACSPAAACPMSAVTYTIRKNSVIVGAANRPVTTTTGILTAGTYVITFTGSCGTTACTCSVTINIDPCQCGGWLQTAWSSNGVQQTKINNCGQTVHAEAGSNLTFTPAYTCSPVTCAKAPVTYTITQNGNIVGAPNRPATTQTGILTAGTYLITFTGYCGSTPCTCNVTVIVDPGCSCDGWYKLQYELPGGSMTPVNCVTPQTVTIHKQEKISFIVQGQCQGNCTSKPGIDIYYPGNTGTHPDQHLDGDEFTYMFDHCGDYRVSFTNSCGDSKCADCYITVHVDCSPAPCTCSWSTIKINTGTNLLNISCKSPGAPPVISPGIPIQVISAISPCTGEACTSNVSAIIKDMNNLTLATFSSLPFIFSPPANYCGILNIVIKGQCGTTQCGDCVIQVNIACCACPAVWNNITYKFPGNPVTQLAVCSDTLKTTFGQALNNITAGFQCNLPICNKTNMKYRVYGPNNYSITYMQGNGLTFTFPSTAPCGMYKVVFQGKCGNADCQCVIYIKVSPGCCEYINKGTHSKQVNGTMVKFVSTFTITGAPILFDSVKVQLLWLSINNTIRNNANIVSITKTSGNAWTATQPLAITSPGNAIWFTNMTATTATLQLTGNITTVGALNASSVIKLGLRYTFYRHTSSCGWTICERDFIIINNQ